MTTSILLPHRSIIAVTGPDTRDYLQNILTLDTGGRAPAAHAYGALLTPQGKILADMILTPSGDGFLIDVAASAAADTVRRLTLFRLRSKVAISLREDLAVACFSGAPDPRSANAPARDFVPRASLALPSPADLERYHAARITAGVAEQDADFVASEVFPADINMDLLGGVDFRKGCFVGQEVVSRMKRRATARRRTAPLRISAGLERLAPVMAGDAELGVITSLSGDVALARLRIDRLAEAETAGVGLSAGGEPASLIRPDWLDAEVAKLAAAREGAPQTT